ncbi:MAG: Unknown protein [uncultured Sulfurovum sp.]|uniref:Uncharacterized protein n=1 Tax=uncultured Sulfurovum sp. TaxID=269237 RepID=A0A6S6SZ97_9BACT|nr:MAG: Unknown protein [uncultured Sulfurovum sp.]
MELKYEKLNKVSLGKKGQATLNLEDLRAIWIRYIL